MVVTCVKYNWCIYSNFFFEEFPKNTIVGEILCVCVYTYSIYSSFILTFTSCQDFIFICFTSYFLFLFYSVLKYFKAIPRHQVILALCAWRCICVSEFKNMQHYSSTGGAAVWRLLWDAAQTRRRCCCLCGESPTLERAVEKWCSQGKPGENSAGFWRSEQCQMPTRSKGTQNIMRGRKGGNG